MERISSFTVDHTRLKKGIYLSRVDGDISTYDLRLRRPNAEPVLENAALHTIEHLGATYLRNSAYKDHIIYFGPMGCRTGCYLLTRGLDDATVLDLVRQTFRFIANFKGEIPGASAVECGNYLDHDLEGARKNAKLYSCVLSPLSPEQMRYDA